MGRVWADVWEHMCIVLLIGGEEGCVYSKHLPCWRPLFVGYGTSFSPEVSILDKKKYVSVSFLSLEREQTITILFWASKYDIASAFFKWVRWRIV